jgi:dinuclear metal center YbgI/SA1388 family protein
VKTVDCVAYINQLLDIDAFGDYVPNGLQVSGKADIETIVTGVTASQELLNAAIAANADAVIVHHGYFFKGEPEVITGIKRQRIATLLEHDINLLAYHLPLDFHPLLGNNVLLADILGFQMTGTFAVDKWPNAGCYGCLPSEQAGEQLADHIAIALGRAPLHIAGNTRPIKSIAWATGAAQDFIIEAHQQGVDAFLTGEASERTCHFARELGIHFFAAGHHATERYGVRALGEHLVEKFQLQHTFIDIDNPI